MPNIPAACQPLAVSIAADELEDATLARQARQQTGALAWATLAQLGSLRAATTAKRVTLDACLITATAAVPGALVVIDARPSPLDETRTVALWDLDHPDAPAEESAVVGGGFGLPGPVPQRVALSVVSTPRPPSAVPAWPGCDFRSGVLDQQNALPPHVELLLLPATRVDAATLREWGAGVSTPAERIDGPVTLDIAISGIDVTPRAGMIAVVVHATVGATQPDVGPLPGAPASIALAASLELTPETGPESDGTLRVRVSTSPPVSVIDGGAFGAMAAVLLPLVVGFVSGRVTTVLAGWLNDRIPGLVARAVALQEFPDGCRVSVRSIESTESGLVAQAVVGTLGNALSTFVPQNIAPA